MASLIPDSVRDTFGELLGVYTEIEAMKANKRLAEARLSLASLDLPNYQQDAQAKSQSVTATAAPAFSGAAMLGLGIVGAVALYLIVRK